MYRHPTIRSPRKPLWPRVRAYCDGCGEFLLVVAGAVLLALAEGWCE